MRRRDDWSDGNYMEWADQERLVRQDLEEIRRLENKEDMAMKFEIEKHLAVLSEADKDGYRKELNIVSWNDRKPKYDIRAWNGDYSGMKKGVTLNNEEMRELARAATAHMEVNGNGQI